MTLERAAEHKGTAFVEVYQNCNVFNDGAFEPTRRTRHQGRHTLYLEHGKPLIFGKNRDKGIRLHGMDPEVVDAGQGHHRGRPAVPRREAPEPSLAFLLSRMRHEDGFPEPIGVFRGVDKPRYDVLINEQIEQATRKRYWRPR